MNKKINAIARKALFGGVAFLGCVAGMSDSAYAYTSTYFDVKIDVMSRRLQMEEPKVISVDDNGIGIVEEDKKWGSNKGVIYDKGSNGGRHKYYPNPKIDKVLDYSMKEPPIVDQENFGFIKYIRSNSDKNKAIRRSTFPAYPMHKIEGGSGGYIKFKGGTLDVAMNNGYFGEKLGRLYASAEGIDKNEEIKVNDKDTRIGLIGGVNRVLDKIEEYRGPFSGKTNEEFLPILMDVTKLISGQYDGGGQVNPTGKTGDKMGCGEIKIIHPKKMYEKANEKKEKDEDGKKLNPEGKNIIVKVSGRSNYKVKVSIGLEGENKFEEIGYIPYSLDTGFLYKGNKSYVDKSGMMQNVYTYNVPVGNNNGKVKYETYAIKQKDANAKFDAKQAAGLEVLTTYDLVSGAVMSYVNGNYASNGEKPPGIMGILYDMLDGLLSAFESLIGIINVDTIIFNKGDRAAISNRYQVGIYPTTWNKTIEVLYGMSLVVSVACVGFSILRILLLMDIDSLNVATRYNVKKEIMNLIFVVFGMLLIIPFYKLMATLNYILVDFIYSAYGEPADLAGYMSSNLGLLSTLVQRWLYIAVSMYINVVYIFRALNVAILVGLSPVFVMSIALGKSDEFKKYIAMLVENIFIQSVHAVIMIFVANAAVATSSAGLNGRSGIFMQIILTYALIPTTKIFKELMLGRGNSLSGAVDTASSNLTNGARGYAALKAVGAGVGASAIGSGIMSFNKHGKDIQARVDKAKNTVASSAEAMKNGESKPSMTGNIEKNIGKNNSSMNEGEKIMNTRMSDSGVELGDRAINTENSGEKEDKKPDWEEMRKNAMKNGVKDLANGMVRGVSMAAKGNVAGVIQQGMDTGSKINSTIDKITKAGLEMKNERKMELENSNNDFANYSNVNKLVSKEDGTIEMERGYAKESIANIDDLANGKTGNTAIVTESGYKDMKKLYMGMNGNPHPFTDSIVNSIDTGSNVKRDKTSGNYIVKVDENIMNKTKIGKKGDMYTINNI